MLYTFCLGYYRMCHELPTKDIRSKVTLAEMVGTGEPTLFKVVHANR